MGRHWRPLAPMVNVTMFDGDAPVFCFVSAGKRREIRHMSNGILPCVEIVRRMTSRLIVAAPLSLIAAGAASAAEEERKPDIEMGARLVEARCVVCHREQSLPDLVDRCTSDHGGSYLDAFLKRHHAPDEEARADIIAYLTCPPALLPQK